MKTDISDLREQLIEEARSRISEPVGKDEITSTALAEELGCSTRAAYDILEGMVNDGRATVREKVCQGRRVYRYQEDRL